MSSSSSSGHTVSLDNEDDPASSGLQKNKIYSITTGKPSDIMPEAVREHNNLFARRYTSSRSDRLPEKFVPGTHPLDESVERYNCKSTIEMYTNK